MLINQTAGALSPSVTVPDLEGNILSSEEYDVGSVATPSCAE